MLHPRVGGACLSWLEWLWPTRVVGQQSANICPTPVTTVGCPHIYGVWGCRKRCIGRPARRARTLQQ
eukprot:13780873-Heterocapsa_arctica.AAC.1